jgi:hypothetical protein
VVVSEAEAEAGREKFLKSAAKTSTGFGSSLLFRNDPAYYITWLVGLAYSPRLAREFCCKLTCF